MSEGIGLTDRMNNMESNIEEIKQMLNNGKKKKFGLKMKGLLGRRKLRLGYCIVRVRNENGAITFRKEPIVDSTIKLDDTFHVLDAECISTYKNKPYVEIDKDQIWARGKTNPDSIENQTRGQKYILARMQNEAIQVKKGIGAMGGWILLLLIAGGVAYYFFGGGGG